MLAALYDTLIEKTILLVGLTIVTTYITYAYAIRQGLGGKLVGKHSLRIFLLPFALLFAVRLLPFPYSLLGLLAFGGAFGLEMAMILPHYHEETVKQALSLTTILTLAVGYFGYTTPNDLSRLYPILFIALIGLILWNVFILWKKSEGQWAYTIRAIFGACLFVVFIIVDLNRIASFEKLGVGSWQHATEFALSIYIDVINLFLYILQLLGNGN